VSNGNQAFAIIYILLALVLVGSALAARRVPIGQGLKMAAAWVVIFGLAFVAFTFKDDIGDLGRSMASGPGDEPTVRQSVRIPKAPDGRFWANVQLNGQPALFLVDSGTTINNIPFRPHGGSASNPAHAFLFGSRPPTASSKHTERGRRALYWVQFDEKIWPFTYPWPATTSIFSG
jgi:hypothetical protein